MTDTIELIDKAEVRDGQAIVKYSRTEHALAILREKYKDAKYDLTTTAGDKAARAARLELKTLRTDLEKKRTELKAPALLFGKTIDSEAARLTAEIQALETPIDAQIKADEKRREDERIAKEQAEAARRKVYTDGIAKIAGYVEQAADLPAARIAAGITYLEGMNLADFDDYLAEATATRDRTVAALRALHAKAVAREEEAARLDAERIEQARIAAEQAETARKLKEQQDELDRQRAEVQQREERIAAEERAKLEREALERAAAERLQAEAAAAAERAAQAAAASPTPAPTYPPAAPTQPLTTGPVNVVPMPTKAPAATAMPPSLKLGEIQRRIAPLSIDAAGLAALGFQPATTQGAAKMYAERDLPRMLAAMLQHIGAVQAKLAA